MPEGRRGVVQESEAKQWIYDFRETLRGMLGLYSVIEGSIFNTLKARWGLQRQTLKSIMLLYVQMLTEQNGLRSVNTLFISIWGSL